MKMYFFKYLLSILFLGSMIACSEMDATYRDLVKDGETIYPGKADSLQVMPGNKRIKLSWELSADPRVKIVKVYWNSKKDSVEIPVIYKGEPQNMSTIIENLAEAKHNFNIITYDNLGNRSVMVEVQGEVFGPIYESSLANRPLLDVKLIDYKGHITWADVPNSIGAELNYVDQSGTENKLFIPA